MTYAGFLGVFLVIPILFLLWAGCGHLGRRHFGWIGLLALIAVAYTTLWDNYLVAKQVWTYEPRLTSGIVLGWVPLEEYIFFMLQPLLTGLWLFVSSRKSYRSYSVSSRPKLRWLLPLALGGVWIGALITLLLRYREATYMALELAWALPPIMLQLAFGADILWRRRRQIMLALLPATLYLAAADAIAIAAGIWTINPEQSLNLYLGGVLPAEELLFFLLTNTLIVFALTLLQEAESMRRLAAVQGLLQRPLLRERRFSAED